MTMMDRKISRKYRTSAKNSVARVITFPLSHLIFFYQMQYISYSQYPVHETTQNA